VLLLPQKIFDGKHWIKWTIQIDTILHLFFSNAQV
jgi:hypothetical protein